MSSLSGRNPRTIQRRESGAKISTESLRALAAVFDVPAESLLLNSQASNQPGLAAMREAVSRGLQFSGTTGRADFWWFALVVAMLLGVAKVAQVAGPLPLQIAALLALLPWIAACTRRASSTRAAAGLPSVERPS